MTSQPLLSAIDSFCAQPGRAGRAEAAQRRSPSVLSNVKRQQSTSHVRYRRIRRRVVDLMPIPSTPLEPAMPVFPPLPIAKTKSSSSFKSSKRKGRVSRFRRAQQRVGRRICLRFSGFRGPTVASA
jgi:hypothetical protein